MNGPAGAIRRGFFLPAALGWEADAYIAKLSLWISRSFLSSHSAR